MDVDGDRDETRRRDDLATDCKAIMVQAESRTLVSGRILAVPLTA
jgi:hypothetical protein